MPENPTIKQMIDDLGGPERVAFAFLAGLGDRDIRKAAERLFGRFDEVIPKNHPLRSSTAERATGVTQALFSLRYSGLVAGVVQRFFDYGQKRWFNGTPPNGDWAAEFQGFSQESIAKAEDPAAEGTRLQKVLAAQRAIAKSIRDLQADELPPETQDKGGGGDLLRESVRRFDEAVGGALRKLNDRMGF